MPIIDTAIEGLKVFEPRVFEDDRGYFFESYNYNTFKAGGIDNVFVQDNQSASSYGVLRGLHYQVAPFTQAKLVRVLEGEVLDVAVDLREDSPTYGQSFSIQVNTKTLAIR
ncbi:MAG: dTDP-4-dehydrorhamnose 3,5-epimerase family protein, partial [Bacteroidota bacterium]